NRLADLHLVLDGRRGALEAVLRADADLNGSTRPRSLALLPFLEACACVARDVQLLPSRRGLAFAMSLGRTCRFGGSSRGRLCRREGSLPQLGLAALTRFLQ